MIVKNLNNNLHLDFGSLNNDQNKLTHVIVVVPANIVNRIYKEAINSQKNEISPYGFHKDNVPLEYVEKNLKINILEHLKEFLLKYFVVSFLFKELRQNKINFIGDPRLNKIELDPDNDAKFYFEFTPTEKINLEDWKFLPFKAPKRKNYKDLDKQAAAFLKEESSKQALEYLISIGDWICINIFPITKETKIPLFEEYKENLWLKIGDDEPSLPFQELFLKKKIGDIFYTNSNCFQSYFDNLLNSNYLFCIEIKDIVSKEYFSIDSLKEHFKLKTNKSLHQKLIEVFSYRNDLSLRKVIVEELFDLFFSKFHFEVPNPAVLRQQKVVLDILQTNPDYPVYKIQPEFEEKVRLLALNQVKELMLIDQLTYHENIEINHDDVRHYLNLSNRPRTKEFIYFQHPIIKANEQEYPIPSELIKQYSIREKTLNFVLNHLTRY